ncbi:hypothetical protein C2E23DRAFT_260060 [Lenzites betulinus]|nr:hypothetical protein C2E23DRAFT_260060 [Lenzites betulinus]
MARHTALTERATAHGHKGRESGWEGVDKSRSRRVVMDVDGDTQTRSQGHTSPTPHAIPHLYGTTVPSHHPSQFSPFPDLFRYPRPLPRNAVDDPPSCGGTPTCHRWPTCPYPDVHAYAADQNMYDPQLSTTSPDFATATTPRLPNLLLSSLEQLPQALAAAHCPLLDAVTLQSAVSYHAYTRPPLSTTSLLSLLYCTLPMRFAQ